MKTKKKNREEQEKEDKRVEGKKRLTFLLIFISSTLEIVSGEEKTLEQSATSLTLFSEIQTYRL
jgi:hypothetical protein